VAFSQDNAYFVDTWSRVDLAPTTEIRRVADKTVVMTVEKGDISGLLKSGWRTPEVFVAKARDGKTDIWGIINPADEFRPRKKYPVIEYIYAGPQGSFVPKSFQATSGMRPWPSSASSSASATGWHEQPLQGLPRCLL